MRLGFLSVAIALSFACAGSPRRAQRDAEPRPFAYAVEAHGARSVVFGTMHLGFGFDEVQNPAGLRAFDDASHVWLETDLRGADGQALLEAAMLPADASLPGIVGMPRFVELSALLAGRVPRPVLERVQPWFPALLLGLAQYEEALRATRPEATARRMDAELLVRAERDDKEVRFLETMAQQVAIFERMPRAEQIASLERTLRGETQAEASKSIAAYAAGDERALAETVLARPGARSFTTSLLAERNRAWLKVLTPELRRGGRFVAVGVAHLLGPEGLLSLLEAEGFEVERL